MDEDAVVGGRLELTHVSMNSTTFVVIDGLELVLVGW